MGARVAQSGKWLGYRLDSHLCGSWQEQKIFSLQNVQTGSRDCPVSYLLGARFLVLRLGKVGTILLLPHMLSWHGKWVFTSVRSLWSIHSKISWQLCWDQRLKMHPVFSVHFSAGAWPCDSLYSVCVCIVMLQWLLWWRLQRWWRASWSLTIALLS